MPTVRKHELFYTLWLYIPLHNGHFSNIITIVKTFRLIYRYVSITQLTQLNMLCNILNLDLLRNVILK